MLRILILMSRTGGGHLASARALEAEFRRQRPDVAVTIVDMLSDHLRFPFNQLPRTYDGLVSRFPGLWSAMWHGSARSRFGDHSSAIIRRLSHRHLARLITETAPDLVVSVHPLVNDLIVPVLEKVRPSARYVTVVTDLGGIHPSWLHPRNSAVYLPTEQAVAGALARGLPRERLHVHGLPVRTEFSERPAGRAAARTGFGLDPERPVALVVGGGGGIGPIEAIVSNLGTSLAAAGSDAQIVVVTAKNEALKRRIEANPAPVPVMALGFVDRMSDLMQASDILITKAGPGTIAEASIRALPMAIYGFIPGQEAANVDHVVEAGAGLFEPDPARLAARVAGLLGPEWDELAAMAAAARHLGREQATHDIVASILAGHGA
jgi:1,2-diacylglycerol 3-beta-galactosyltransferase